MLECCGRVLDGIGGGCGSCGASWAGLFEECDRGRFGYVDDLTAELDCADLFARCVGGRTNPWTLLLFVDVEKSIEVKSSTWVRV